MQYASARHKSEMRDIIYRTYITDALKAKLGLNIRFYDLAYIPKEMRSADEIINRVGDTLSRLGGEKT